MAPLYVSAYEPSSEPPGHYEIPRSTSCPSNAPCIVTPDDSTPEVWLHLEQAIPGEGSDDGLDKLYRLGDNFYYSGGKIPLHYSEYGIDSDGWATWGQVNEPHGHSQHQTPQGYYQEVIGDNGGMNFSVNPLHTYHTPPSTISTPGSTRDSTPEGSEERGFLVENVSARMNRVIPSAESTSRELSPSPNPRAPKFPCSKGCGEKFSRRADEKRHCESSYAHKKGRVQKYYICGHCKTKFNRRDNLKQHWKREIKKCNWRETGKSLTMDTAFYETMD